MPEDNIAIRLKFLITNLGINSSVFADNCGISRATLSQLLTGRNKKINDILISQIHKAYPDLSILWLLFNEGPMWIKDGNETHDAISSDTNVNDLPSRGSSSRNDITSSNPELIAGTENSITHVALKNPSEIINFPSDRQRQSRNHEENGLNSMQNEDNLNDIQGVNSCIKTAELINEINNLKAKIRKVVQITIYYDDSTFESFFPSQKKN